MECVARRRRQVVDERAQQPEVRDDAVDPECVERLAEQVERLRRGSAPAAITLASIGS